MDTLINQGRDVVDAILNTQYCYSTEVSHRVEHYEQSTGKDGG